MSDLNVTNFDNSDDNSDQNNFITLTDDSGEDIHFEVLDEFTFRNNNYIVLIPFEDVDDEVVILEVINSNDSDDDEYLSVDDDTLLNDIFEEFKKRNASNFDFVD